MNLLNSGHRDKVRCTPHIMAFFKKNSHSYQNEDVPFTYDLAQMKLAMESPRITAPSDALLSDEAFEAWVDSLEGI